MDTLRSPVKSPLRGGFTLIEMSIVLVIIGLIIGAIMVGRDLMRAGELRAIGAESMRYRTAMNGFRDKYQGLPGDITNATSFWGTEAAGGGCPYNTVASTTTATCNGDGDWNISTYPYANNLYETYRAWQQLANAGLIEGGYTGITASGNALLPLSVIGSNVPASKYNGGGWSLFSLSIFGNWSTWFTANYGSFLVFGGYNAGAFGGVAPGLSSAPILKAEDAYNIDNKLDDGLPQSGMILTFKYNAASRPDCVNSSNTGYNRQTTSQNACFLMFLTGY